MSRKLKVTVKTVPDPIDLEAWADAYVQWALRVLRANDRVAAPARPKVG